MSFLPPSEHRLDRFLDCTGEHLPPRLVANSAIRVKGADQPRTGVALRFLELVNGAIVASDDGEVFREAELLITAELVNGFNITTHTTV